MTKQAELKLSVEGTLRWTLRLNWLGVSIFDVYVDGVRVGSISNQTDSVFMVQSDAKCIVLKSYWIESNHLDLNANDSCVSGTFGMTQNYLKSAIIASAISLLPFALFILDLAVFEPQPMRDNSRAFILLLSCFLIPIISTVWIVARSLAPGEVYYLRQVH